MALEQQELRTDREPYNSHLPVGIGDSTRVQYAADLEADAARVQAANQKPPRRFLDVAAAIERAHRAKVNLSASARRERSMRLPVSDQAQNRASNDRRNELLTLEDGLIDLQELSVELKMETTAALLRMVILDVRQ